MMDNDWTFVHGLDDMPARDADGLYAVITKTGRATIAKPVLGIAFSGLSDAKSIVTNEILAYKDIGITTKIIDELKTTKKARNSNLYKLFADKKG